VYVQDAWNRHVPAKHNAFSRLHIKLSRTAKALKSWSTSQIFHRKVVLAICREVIEKLEQAQEERHLTGGRNKI
jgi:hypothetical protein